MKRNIVVSLLLVLLMLFVVSCEEPKHEHTLEKVEAVAATCTEEGMKEYYQCSVCKQTFADKEAKTEVKDLATLKTDKDPANHAGVKKVDAKESTCTVNGTVEHWHCEGCEKNYRDKACKNELESLVAPLIIHEAGDGVVTGESFTLGEVTYPIYKCEHDVFYLDEACTEKLYKDYFDAAGLVVTEKDGVLDAYFSDCDVFMSTDSPSTYNYIKAVAYFTDKKFARLGYNNDDVGGLDATENKALTLTATKDEEGNIQITGESEKKKMPLTGITSITLNDDKSGLVMVANGGEIWNLKPYNNPLRGTYKDAAGNTLTFGRYVMKYTLSGEETFYVADIDGHHAKILSNGTNSGPHGNTTFGFRQYVFLGDNLYFKWDVDLPGVPKWSGTAFCEYVPFVE